MYTLDKITIVNYDPEVDAMSIDPSDDVLAMSKYIKSIDINNKTSMIIDIGNQNNIRSIEFLNVSNLFNTTLKSIINALKNQIVPYVEYSYFPGNEEFLNVLDVFLKGIGGLRATWHDNNWNNGKIEEHLYILYTENPR